jgi:hypothetical protein
MQEPRRQAIDHLIAWICHCLDRHRNRGEAARGEEHVRRLKRHVQQMENRAGVATRQSLVWSMSASLVRQRVLRQWRFAVVVRVWGGTLLSQWRLWCDSFWPPRDRL